MYKNFLHFFLITGLLLCCIIKATAMDNEGYNKTVAKTRSIIYYPDGSIKSITEIYPNNQSVKKNYDEAETLTEKILPDGAIIRYSYEFSEGHKTATEHYDNEGIIIKRHFNNKNQIVKSEYPGYSEQYEYTYDSIGDINKITIIKEDGTKEETLPTDNRLSFLYDYDIIGHEIMDDFSRISDKEYIYNPTRFKEKMMMHKKYNHPKKY